MIAVAKYLAVFLIVVVCTVWAQDPAVPAADGAVVPAAKDMTECYACTSYTKPNEYKDGPTSMAYKADVAVSKVDFFNPHCEELKIIDEVKKVKCEKGCLKIVQHTSKDYKFVVRQCGPSAKSADKYYGETDLKRTSAGNDKVVNYYSYCKGNLCNAGATFSTIVTLMVVMVARFLF